MRRSEYILLERYYTAKTKEYLFLQYYYSIPTFGEKDSIHLEDLVLQGNTMLGALLPQLEPTMPEALRRTQQKTPGAMRHQIEQTMPGALWA